MKKSMISIQKDFGFNHLNIFSFRLIINADSYMIK